MSWMAAIGGVVASAFGATAISAGMAAVVGGLVVGAAAGALYTAFKDGNLLKNMAFGALGGAALGGIGAYMVGGTAAFTSANSAALTGLGAAESAANVSAVWGGMSGAAEAGGGGAVAGLLGGGTGNNVMGMGGLASLGAAFLNGKAADKDRDAELAWKEKEYELANKKLDQDMTAAEMAASTSRENALTAAETAASQLEFAREKFSKEFAEDKRRYDTERQDAQDLRDQFRQSVVAGSQYASGSTPTIRPLELKRQRMELPQPSWITGKNQQQQVAQNNPQQQQQQQQGPPAANLQQQPAQGLLATA